MTLQEFYENLVLPVMGMTAENADWILPEQYVGVTNSVLTACLPLNNTMRRLAGKTSVTAGFYGVNDELPFEDQLLADCICYGVAARLYVDQLGDEGNVVNFLEANYEDGKHRYDQAVYTANTEYVEDVLNNG